MTPRVEAVLLALGLGAAAVLFSQGASKAPNYDEGVYLATDDALRAGGELGSEVFSSQPPGFYVLLRLATALPGDSVSSARLLFLALSLAGLFAAWALGRALVGPAGGIAAAAVLAVSPAYAANATRVAADVPAMVLALAGLAALAVATERRSTRFALVGGVALGLAVAVKLFAVVAFVPAAMLLVRRSRLALTSVLGAAATAFVFLLLNARSLSALYDDVVGFHREAREGGQTLRGNLETVVRSLHPRLAWPWLVGAGAVAAFVRPRMGWRAAPLWLWAVASALFLVWHRPLLDHHFALLAASASTAAGATLGGAVEPLRRARLPAALLLGLVVAASYGQQWRALGRLPDPEPDVRNAAALLADRTAPGETVVTDLPIVAYLADRRLPGELVDTSAVRFQAGSLDPECVLQLADAGGVRVVVVGRIFRTIPSLLRSLRERFPEERRVGEITLLARDRAAARAARGAAPGPCSGRRASRSPSSSAGAPRG